MGNLPVISLSEEFEDTKESESIYRRTDNTMIKRKKIKKDKQRSTKLAHKTKDRVTRTTLKPGVN